MMSRAGATTGPARRDGARIRAAAASIGRQRGVALLTAVVLVALGTILATAIAFQTGMTARSVASTLAFDQTLLVAEAGEALAAYALSEDAKGATKIDYPAEPWGPAFGPVEIVPGITLEAQLEDLQGRFNLNSLVMAGGGGTVPGRTATVNPDAVADFQRLLESLGLEPEWAQKIVDWIDADSNAESGGAEDETYTAQDPNYRALNLPISSVSELLSLPGFGRDKYRALAPYVVALPANVGVNVCSAKGEVLDALADTRQFALANLADEREGKCFPDLQTEFTPAVSQAQVPKLGRRVSNTSNYFRLTSIVTIGTSQFALYSLLYRDSSGQVRPLMRSFTAD